MSIVNSLLGVALGIGAGNLATVLKHLVNFPLNFIRLREMHRLVLSVRDANAGDLKIEWLKPFVQIKGVTCKRHLYSVRIK